jgi:predicted ABC-type transport system involved in lysophospholipase L1 biosynthesis ATPase subunit
MDDPLMIPTQAIARTFRTRRGPVEAVRGVDFSVKAGEIVGFLGPNGAPRLRLRSPAQPFRSAHRSMEGSHSTWVS